MIKNIRHVGFVTANLEKALKFYTEILDLKIIEQGKLDQYETLKLIGIVDSNIIWIKLGTEENNCLLELYYFESAKVREWFSDLKIDDDGYEVYSYHHISFTVDNIEKLHFTLIKENVEMICSPSIDALCKHKIFFARDNDGNLIEFVEKI